MSTYLGCFKVIGITWLCKKDVHDMICWIYLLVASTESSLVRQDPNCPGMGAPQAASHPAHSWSESLTIIPEGFWKISPKQRTTASLKHWDIYTVSDCSPKHTSIHMCSPNCFLICRKIRRKYVSVTEKNKVNLLLSWIDPIDCWLLELFKETVCNPISQVQLILINMPEIAKKPVL